VRLEVYASFLSKKDFESRFESYHDDFEKRLSRMREDLLQLQTEIQARLERIENKIDKLFEGRQEIPPGR
jgi:hypothetical protein